MSDQPLNPYGCGAEQNTANLPANNPPHICVLALGHPLPHADFSGFSWTQPEPKHDWRVAP